MAQLIIEVPDDQIDKVCDAFLHIYGENTGPTSYQGDPTDTAAKSEFVRTKVIEFLTSTVASSEVAKAQAAAQASAASVTLT